MFKIIFSTHKTVNKAAPEYLSDIINVNDKGTTVLTGASIDPLFIMCSPN